MTKKITTFYLKYLQQKKNSNKFFLFWLCSVWDTLRDTQVMRKHGFGDQEKNQRAWNENLGILYLNMIFMSSEGIREPSFWCSCSTIVLAKQSLMVSLTLTGLKLTFRGQRRSRRDMSSPLSFALLEGPKQCGLCFYASTVFSEFVF